MEEQMGTDVTIVVDNKADGGLTEEHGFSLWIQTQGKRILFDTGQGPALQRPLRLGDTVGRTGPIPRLNGYEDTGGVLHADR